MHGCAGFDIGYGTLCFRGWGDHLLQEAQRDLGAMGC
jgi:hypothetical protein